jgi:septal ring-binding cell division protein DamX
MYSFLFDRKSLLLMLAGLATAGCLLFVSGLLVGVFYGLPGSGPPEVAAASPRALPAAWPSSSPCPPVPADLRLRAESAVPRAEARPAPPEDEATASPALPDVAEKWAEAAPAFAVPDPDPVRDAETEAEPTAAPGPRAAEPQKLADLEPSARDPAVRSTPGGRFSLQVGAFRQAENSARAVEELLRRGYDAYVVEEGRGRPLRSVLVGRYADREAARRAALDFKQREGQEAIVRTAGL